LFVRADVTRLKQILLNLIGNAVKFTPEGGRIRLVAAPDGDRVRIEVHDTGPGIPREERQRIFEAFHRLRTAGDATEGTGLGLAITLKLVQLHGGELDIKSEVGEGSCFYFFLPAVIKTSPDGRDKSGRSKGHKEHPRVLVIEDDSAAAQLMSSQLTPSGYDVLCCQEPKRACQMAAEFQPDAITLDLMMKPINGWDVLVELKSDSRTAEIPVVIVTIVDQPGMGAILGADEYLVKPVEQAVLLAAVERCIRSRGGRPPSQQILVVEDDAPTREMISELLTARGYEVRTVPDGQAARSSVVTSLPGLVILDLLLPKVGGFELIAEWRSHTRTADLPIFVLTSKDLSLDETKYIRANAEFLMQKQQDWKEALLKQLQRAVPQHQLEATT
jgi:DNA-binding response OmpR family regulator/anti-sigma regulatory factor (Ser/Thr protein kinase)